MEVDLNSFLKDVSNHEMKIIKDDGIYRRIHFSNKDIGFDQWFEIVTWPGELCIRGDMGCYVFSRVDDMFKFFRGDGAHINPGYWHEKCQSADTYGGIKKFCPDVFRERVYYEVKSHIDDLDLSDEASHELVEHVKDEVIGYADEEHFAIHSIYTFEDFVDRDGNTFNFGDFWEGGSVEKYSNNYLWCLYAIVWGIKQYDKA